MRRVAGPDATFLSAERPEWHFHVSALVVLDSGKSNRFSFEAVRTTLEQRLHLAPQFRWKLADHPLWPIVRPNWIDDVDFDIDRHVVHIALPPRRVTTGRSATLVGRLVSTKIDRSRPLWEMWLIDGLERRPQRAAWPRSTTRSSTASPGTELAQLLFDLEPDPPAVGPQRPGVAVPNRRRPTRRRCSPMLPRTPSEWPVRAAKLGWQFASQGRDLRPATRCRPAPTTHPFAGPEDAAERAPHPEPLVRQRRRCRSLEAKAVKDRIRREVERRRSWRSAQARCGRIWPTSANCPTGRSSLRCRCRCGATTRGPRSGPRSR